MFYRTYFIITNKIDLNKENARIKKVLKESTINKILKRLTHKHQNENKLLYVKGTTEKHFKGTSKVLL